jgi:hypothetical protein
MLRSVPWVIWPGKLNVVIVFVMPDFDVVCLVCRIILNDLDEPVFQKLFSPDWEKGLDDSNYIATAIATMKDYLQDFSHWLVEYFYCKLVYEMMSKFIAMYVMSLRRFPPGSFKFNLEFKAAKMIIDDQQALAAFFENYMDELIQAGAPGTGSAAAVASGDPIENELSTMRALSMIISASHISSVDSEVRLIYSKYGVDGQKLVQSAINSNPALSKADRTEMLDAAANIFLKKSAYAAIASTDEYRNVADAHIEVGAAAKAAKPKTRFFWA